MDFLKRPISSHVPLLPLSLFALRLYLRQQHINDNLLTDVKTLYIDDLCVDENARGQHIGRELYDYVLGRARTEGYYNITLNVRTCNESAKKFYESIGMTPYKTGMEQIL